MWAVLGKLILRIVDYTKNEVRQAHLHNYTYRLANIMMSIIILIGA